MQRIERTFAGRRLVIETGRMAKQAAGSALVQFGDTMVLAAVTVSDTESPLSFFPLLVEYRDKAYAAGKIPGGFIKREGRPSLLMKPPGILPAAYALSLYSTRSGKKLSGLSVSLTVTAARTIVSPNWTRADPAACFAMRPVSMTRRLPANVLSMRCICVVVVSV